MIYRIVPAIIVVLLIVIGHILKRVKIYDYNKRRESTIIFQNNFISMVNAILERRTLDNKLYGLCIHDVDMIQQELGEDGVLSEYIDPLKQVKGRNYQIFMNILPEIRSMISMLDNMIMAERFNQMIGLCDDSLRRHTGNLDRAIDSVKKNLYNPFSCFGEGIRWIIGLPVDILYWLGIIGTTGSYKIKSNGFFKVISNVIVFIGLISSVVTIVLGWDEFKIIIVNLFD